MKAFLDYTNELFPPKVHMNFVYMKYSKKNSQILLINNTHKYLLLFKHNNIIMKTYCKYYTREFLFGIVALLKKDNSTELLFKMRFV